MTKHFCVIDATSTTHIFLTQTETVTDYDTLVCFKTHSTVKGGKPFIRNRPQQPVTGIL